MKWVALLVVPAAACGSVANNDKIDAKTADSPQQQIDARGIDTPPPRCNLSAPFGTPVALDTVNSTAIDSAPSLSPDELTIYFYSNRSGAGTVGGVDIYVATRSSITSPFGTPAVLAGVNSAGDDEFPSITADGLYLYVDRYASGTTGWDIWVSQRANTNVDFGAPTRVDSLNSVGAVEDDNQTVLPNNSAMYFISGRGGAGSYDIYRAARNVGGTFDAATNVMPTTDQELSMAVTPDELTMFFATSGGATLGGFDIWMTKRTTTADGFGTPVHLSELSSASDEFPTWVSADGCAVYLTRSVVGSSSDIFVARRPQ